MLGSVIATAAVLSVLALPPLAQTLNLQQLLLRAAFDLTLSACIHVIAVTCIWRLIRDYIEPSASVLTIHVWAAVVWLPLVVTLTAERSLWISCIIPWGLANAISFLNLWTGVSYEDALAPVHARVLFLTPSSPPLSRTLLPYCITIVTLQAGLASLATGHPWVAAALLSAAIMLLLARHPFARANPRSRRRFSNYSLLQTVAAFSLISTALTPYLQRAYGFGALSSLLAIKPLAHPVPRLQFHPDYSGIILTLPAKPHPAPEPQPPPRKLSPPLMPGPSSSPLTGPTGTSSRQTPAPDPTRSESRAIPSRPTFAQPTALHSPWKPTKSSRTPYPAIAARPCESISSTATTASGISRSSCCSKTRPIHPLRRFFLERCP